MQKPSSIQLICALALAAVALVAQAGAGAGYKADVEAWRAKVEQSLRKENGWLSLAGRYELAEGANTIGSGKDNQIVLAPGLAPERLGTIAVADDKVTIRLAPEVEMFNARTDPLGFSERTLQTDRDQHDWIYLGRLSMYVLKRDDGRYILRTADTESEARRNFKGRVWYDVDPASRVEAKFIPYNGGKKTEIVNVLGEISDETVAGYLEFKWKGRTHRLDAFADPGEPLFVIFKDGTANSTTYPSGRFLVVPTAKNGRTTIDFNKAYNPPCAFSAYTTCPLPPPQNVMKASVAAGEKYVRHD
jgi:uncharacterized protein (DUF1684 family)